MPLQHRIGRPRFLANPIQYVRWASVAHTGAFWAVVIGGGAFPMCFAMLYARRLAGWDDAPRIPTSWPIPEGPRQPLNDGGKYDDPE